MAKNKEEPKEKKSYTEELEILQKTFNPTTPEDIYLSTGSLALDIALGGKGLKLGRQASLVAWWGAGKTTLALETIHQAELKNLEYAYIDVEHSLDPVYITSIGIDWELFSKRLFQPNSLENAIEIAKKLVSIGAKVIVFDSVSGMLPQKMIEGEAGSNSLGLQARILGPEVVKLKNLAFVNNCLLIYINQIREKVGVTFGSPETAQGGHAIPFFDDYRIEIRKTLEKDNGEKEDATGVTSKFKIVKNKVAPPFKTGQYSIKFGVGIDIITEIIDIASELEILYKHGQVIKLNKDTTEEEKYDLLVFMDMLETNPEFYQSLKTKILTKLGIV